MGKQTKDYKLDPALISKVPKETLEDLYCNQYLSLEKIGKAVGVYYTSVAKLVEHYGLTRDKNKSRNLAIKAKAKERGIGSDYWKEKISKEDLTQYYIIEDHDYYDAMKHFGINEDNFRILLKDYGLHKDKAVSYQKGMQTKYREAGGKEAYHSKIAQKREATQVLKHGSIAEFKKELSTKCKETWEHKPPEEKAECHARTMQHGGGWNHETIKQTLLEKYEVDNAYKLASDYQTNSKVNQRFEDLLSQNGISIRSRELNLGNKRYDFELAGNVLLEINPWPFHNVSWCPVTRAQPLDKNYHKQKSEIAQENGYFCVHIWDWDDPLKVMALLKSRPTVGARECDLKEVSKAEAQLFLESHHLQGYARDKVRLGLYHQGSLVSLMTFDKPRYNKKYEWELVRYCSIYRVQGGAERLLHRFCEVYQPSSIVSYCDKSKFKGLLYQHLGFNLVRVSAPAAHWYNIKTKQHLTDNLVRQRGFDQLFGTSYGKGFSNRELLLEHGFVEIYDCGQATYVWQKKR